MKTKHKIILLIAIPIVLSAFINAFLNFAVDYDTFDDDTTYGIEMIFHEEEYAVEYLIVNGNTDNVTINIPTDLIDGVFMIHVNGKNVDDERIIIDGKKVIVNYGQNIQSVKLFGSHDLSGTKNTKQDIDWSEITLMKPNSARNFYYPHPEDTENRDVFQMFSLIRLPENLGGGADDVSAFRAYSTVTLTTDHCVVKYWSDNGRQRLEDPCWGSMYRVVDGLMITNPDLVMNTSPVALPYLELSIDENGILYVEPPNFTRDENGVIGIGRIITPQEIEHGSQIMIDGYEKSHPNHPKVPVRFAGHYLTELHAAHNDVDARYAQLNSLSSKYIDMRIDNVSAVQQKYFLNFAKTNSEFWQLDDVVFIVSGSGLDPNSELPEGFKSYKIEFVLDGFMFEISGQDDELLKKSIIANYFPNNTYDDMLLISSTVEQ